MHRLLWAVIRKPAKLKPHVCHHSGIFFRVKLYAHEMRQLPSPSPGACHLREGRRILQSPAKRPWRATRRRRPRKCPRNLRAWS